MLHDLDATLKELIYMRGNMSRSTIDISFDQPTADWSSRLSKPTINCWCYDLRQNVKLRNMALKTIANGQSASKRLPPLRFDVTYLITAWAQHMEDEHQLLWRSLAALTRTAVLAPEECEGDLQNQDYEIPLTVAQVGETSQNQSELWSVLDNQMKLGFTLLVTIALDTERGFDVPLAIEPFIKVGVAQQPPQQTLDQLDLQLEIGKKTDASMDDFLSALRDQDDDTE